MIRNRNNQVKFSFVIPAYNVDRYISECIDSVLQQKRLIESLFDVEIILIDDGSTDNTPRICDDYAKRYPNNIVVIHQKNAGPSAARNAGIAKATGEYIIFVDGDDFIKNYSLCELFYFCMEKQHDIVAFGANSYNGISENLFFSVQDILDYDAAKPLSLLKAFLKDDYSFGWVAWHYVYKKSFLIKNSLTFEEGRISEDVDFVLKTFYKANTASCFVKNVVYSYRSSDTSSISRKANFLFVEDLLYFIDKNLTYINDNRNDEELEMLIKLNYQTLVEVVLYWYSSYSIDERKILSSKFDLVRSIYSISKEYNYLYRKKEKIVSKLLKIFGFNTIGIIWGKKRGRIR